MAANQQDRTTSVNKGFSKDINRQETVNRRFIKSCEAEEEEEEERKENIYKYISKDIINEENNPKVFRGYNAHKKLYDSFKLFCAFLGLTVGQGIEWAQMDFMKAHAHRLPVEASFNLVALPKPKEKPKLCGYEGCNEPAIAKGLYLRRKEEFLLCEKHLTKAKSQPKMWKVFSEEGPDD